MNERDGVGYDKAGEHEQKSTANRQEAEPQSKQVSDPYRWTDYHRSKAYQTNESEHSM